MASPAISYEAEEAHRTPDEPDDRAAAKTQVLSGGGRPTVYKTTDGKRVPGVTTITKRFQESGGLIQWAFNCGRDGIDMNRARDDAADAGHLAHAWVDDTIHGRPLCDPPPNLTPDQVAGARQALDAFLEWRDQVKLEIVETEVPLVSDDLKFGGTFDAIFLINGKRRLGDWKTGNRVYGDHLAQMGGYAILLDERGTPVDGVALLRFDKEFGSFAHYNWPAPVLELGKQAFRGMRQLYDVCARLKKAVG